MAKEIICAGFGGQGVLTAGMLLINAHRAPRCAGSPGAMCS